jgi:NTE family protein
MERRSNGAGVDLGQITLLLQGGGALGAYQGGVYQAMHERALEPAWVIGTSIGAINAALIAGNAPEQRLGAVREFWKRIERKSIPNPWAGFVGNSRHAQDTLATYVFGVPGFFEPNLNRFIPQANSVEKAALFSTAPLRKTLSELVDIDRLNSNRPRLTVGATNIQNGVMHYFDSRDMRLDLDHVLASGALPPSFPPVEIDGEYYWDGGVVSNTPIEAVFDDRARRSGLVFAVHLWNRRGPTPGSVQQAWNRLKEIQMSSRTETHIARQKQLHKLRHIIRELAERMPKEHREEYMTKELLSYGCLTRMHVILLQAPALPQEEADSKDIDFTEEAIEARWRAGYDQTARMIEKAPWLESYDPLEGVILHESEAVEHVVTR